MSTINFPSNPSNGDSFFANGIYYVYDSTKGIWKVFETGSNFTLNDAQTLEGNAGAFYLNYNNLNNKPDLTGINASFNQANVAFNQANVAFNQANVGVLNAGSSFNTANIATSTGSSAFNQANLGYDQANIAVVVSGAAFDRANLGYDQANIGVVIGSAAFVQANLGYDQANVAVSSVGAAFNQANTAFLASSNVNPTYENVLASGTISAVNFFTNPSNISSNLTISASVNAMKIGPITINSDVLVTIEQNGSLVII